MYYYPRYRNIYFSSRPYVSRRVVYNPGINFTLKSALAKGFILYQLGKHVLVPAVNSVANDVTKVANDHFPQTVHTLQDLNDKTGKSLDQRMANSIKNLDKKIHGDKQEETMWERGEKAGEELSRIKRNGQGR